jgi:hypothetical protein
MKSERPGLQVHRVLGLGMWRLKNWARMITMILAGGSAVGVVVRMVGTPQQMQTAALCLRWCASA